MESDRKVTVITYDEYLALLKSQEIVSQKMEEIKVLLEQNMEAASRITESNERLENLILEHITNGHKGKIK